MLIKTSWFLVNIDNIDVDSSHVLQIYQYITCIVQYLWVSKYPKVIVLYTRISEALAVRKPLFKGSDLMRAGGQSSPSPTYFSTNWIASVLI